MNQDWEVDQINNLYELILSKLKGSSLYGIPLDTADMKLVVVSAYSLGQREVREQHLDEYRTLWRVQDAAANK